MTYGQLGTLAYLRSEYDSAEQGYQAALVIFEEIGDFNTAERRCQAALAIEDEIGNRVGIARTLSQLGVLRTDQGRAVGAISYPVQGLAIRIKLSSSDSSFDVRMLRQQRAALGDQQFQRILQTLVDVIADIMQLTKQAG